MVKRRDFLKVGGTVLAAPFVLKSSALAFSWPTPDDYTGTDYQKVTAALADSSVDAKKIIIQRMYTIDQAAGIPLPSMKTIEGPGKQCGCGFTKTVPGGALFTSLDPSENYGIQIIGCDINGANVAGTHDDMWLTTQLKQSLLQNNLIRGFTGEALFVDGVASNDVVTKLNRIAAGSNAASSSRGLYFWQGNAMASINDYVSGYQTLIDTAISGFVCIDPTLESAPSGWGFNVSGGNASIFGGWFDPSTMSKTISQNGSFPVMMKFCRGVSASNVRILDTTKWFAEYNPA